jgi:tetratricopeptide (TPR) repeat protein
MKNQRVSVKALLAKSLFLGTLIAATNANIVWAIDPAGDAGVFGSISVANQAREGAKAIKTGDYSKAINAYRTAIGLKSDVPEFYYGLLFAGQKVEAWDQVTLALDAIAEKEPTAKPHLAFEYGNCYTKTGRYDDAVPLLKLALAGKGSDTNFLTGKIQDLLTMTAKPAPPVVLTPEQQKAEEERLLREKESLNPTKPPVIPDAPPQNVDSTEVGADYPTAFRLSEWIGICEYKGYQKKDRILFNNPPIANFYWKKILKGPPLNHDMPIRFKFYEYDGQPKPKDWKFSEAMPKVGSQWLIFIQTAVPREGGFDTYKGSYGRQEANEQNLGEIYAIIEAHHGQ